MTNTTHGRHEFVNGVRLAEYLPAVFRFEIGDSAGRSRLEWTDGCMKYEFLPAEGFGQRHEEALTSIPDEWKLFWKRIKEAGVWDWRRVYGAPTLKGKSWHLELFHEGRLLDSRGSNGYPAEAGERYAGGSPFGRFLSALHELTGKEFK